MTHREWFRRRCLLRGLRNEIKGERPPDLPSCYSIIKEEYGLIGTRQEVFDAFINQTRTKMEGEKDD